MITNANFGEALYPGLKAWFDDEFAQHKPWYPEVFGIVNSDKLSESYLESSGIGLLTNTDDCESMTYEDPVQGYKTTIINTTWKKGIKITRDMVEDVQYPIMNDKTKDLARAAARTMDFEAFKVFRRGFDTAFTSYGDAKPIFSTVH